MLTLTRGNAKSIMALALYSFTFSSEFKSINRVRCLLQVMHLSDISSVNNRSLGKRFLSPKTLTVTRNSYLWSVKHKLFALDFTAWRKFMRWIFPLEPHNLLHPMTAWSKQIVWAGSWYYFLCDSYDFLYHRHLDGRWTRHLNIQNRHHSFYTLHLTLLEPPHGKLLRASVTENRTHIRLLNYSSQNNEIDLQPT